MTPPCRNYHLFIRALPDGFAVHPVGRVSASGDWLRDTRLLVLAANIGPRCLYLDCSGVQVAPFSDLWLKSFADFFSPVLGLAVRFKVVLCGGTQGLGGSPERWGCIAW
jgi:hypothetical protein